ncbi:AAA family ATPase [Agarivorans sp. 1_MG-2023]|uniref:AAA family ATPase n=1 Tax=Agarivorans sp. 1_MG-2023 TaxID=3062634 RepID=UPI0026E382FD|nr:AAA family ATPase [Agarivorans sp. 1_MG-2023]MDO6764077.1 AAA family ATPase [Agarivorans sp. 1_MG-2023]
MAKLILLCGFIGSGKTTYAKKLAEQVPAFRFTMDEWMIPLFGEHMGREVFDHRVATLTRLFQQSAVDLIKLGNSVVLDSGLWRRIDREQMMQWAESLAIDYEIHYLNVSFARCCERAYLRNGDCDQHAYKMTPEMMTQFWQKFEVPTEDELVKWVGD